MLTETRYWPGGIASPQRYRPFVESTVTVCVPALGVSPVAHTNAGTVVRGSIVTVTATSDGSGPSLSSKLPFRMRVSSQTVPVMNGSVAAAERTALALDPDAGR